jgi:hypothetical protein
LSAAAAALALQFDVQVYLKLGPTRVVIPIHISHIQYKALARVVLNMVDTIPCIGALQRHTLAVGSDAVGLGTPAKLKCNPTAAAVLAAAAPVIFLL